ncbi:MAG: chloride channel protein, partial [Cyanobacteriota bacterium]|nr:chloride channel protein [Cyanobacteriota bacterium]
MGAKRLTLLKRLRTWFHNRHFGQQSTEIYYALAEACLIGFVSALAALLLKQGIGLLGSARLSLAREYGSVTLPLFGLTLGFLAGGIIEMFSPAAAGSGIPQVKAVLAQFPLPLSLRVAVVKTIGTILVLAGGLAIGRRGPTVHIGAALAAQLSQWVPTSPQHRRQMIAAGAAAGLAAGFNTPIAGVLFVVEELSRDMSSLTLETTILASFTGSVVSRLLGSADFNIPGEILATSALSEFSPEEIP